MAKVLVVGGAGYVGSATCAYLLDQRHDVWVLDDLSTGHRELALGAGLTVARAGDVGAVSRLLEERQFDCAMHFAARSLVAESVEKPELYYENNVVQTGILLDTLMKAGVNRFVFSSTCAVFGDPGDRDISEDLPKNPINPYGSTKLQAESLMERMAIERGLRAIALRYFNAAGCEPGIRVGEWHEPESHLIPRILAAVRAGEPVQIFGKDYPTPDGTCVRDYIHVTDLARAHESAMRRLIDAPAGGVFETYNLGSENGYSVLEIVKACERVLGRTIPVIERERRAGDPPRLVAMSGRARTVLGFRPERGIDEIIRSAIAWEDHLAALGISNGAGAKV